MKKTAFVSALIWGTLCSGCINVGPMMSTTGSSGPGPSFLERRRWAREHEEYMRGRIIIPMNFELEFKDQKDIREGAKKITRDDVARFLSIGSRAIEKHLVVEFSKPVINTPDWEQDTKAAKLNHLLFGEVTLPAYRFHSELKSGWSTTLTTNETNEFARSVVFSDANWDRRYEYRCKLEANVRTGIDEYRPNRISFYCTVHCILERKNHFADEKYFRRTERIKPGAGESVGRALSQLLFDAYFDSFKAYGIDVKKG